MWFVRIALSRPYTFIVLALLILILGILTIIRTPKDIFPNINIPVVSMVWTYSGLLPEEMAGRITSIYERVLPTLVNDIEHIESQSLYGVSVIKLFFHPTADVTVGLTQAIATAETIMRFLPQGTNPPEALLYNASTVPIIQLVLSSLKLSEQELFDLGNSFIRTQLAPVQGASIPYPYGGKTRQIQADLDEQALQAYGISAQEVSAAMNNQNIIFPAGTQKIGQYEYFVKLNASPLEYENLNNLPIKSVKGTVVYMKDVAHVRDGFAPQTNIVRVNGKRAVLMPIEKTGSTSSLAIIEQTKSLIPKIADSMPASLDLHVIGDQSPFIKAAIHSVLREGVIAAILTGLMIFLFVGNLHSTLIITISIPLSVLTSLIVLSAIGETINMMTLGGLALAIGILVDDATVAVENINWNLEQGKKIETAILDGAQQVAMPALVSTLCICIVFVPILLLSGVAYFLFTPLAEAVIFAMLASYVLSRTLVATLAKYWLRQRDMTDTTMQSLSGSLLEKKSSLPIRLQLKFERRFQHYREQYRDLLKKTLDQRGYFVSVFLIVVLASAFLLTPWLGTDFFPEVDSGQIKIHLSAPMGTRVEETAKWCDEIDNMIRKIIPANEVDNIVDNIGLPVSGINLSYSTSAPVGPQDADIYVALKENHRPTADYVRELRKILPQAFPGVTFSFLPADMIGQILNFGIPTPIDLQIFGFDADANRQYAIILLERVKKIPGIVDARIHQAFNYPQLNINVNRSFAQELGFTQFDIANNLLISLSGSFQTMPTYWLNPKNGVSYSLVAQTPQYRLDSLQSLQNIPLLNKEKNLHILGELASIERGFAAVVESHYNVQPVINIYASLQDRDLGGVAHDINKVIADTKNELPKGTNVIASGQMQTQTTSFDNLFAGLAFAIVLVYLLIVVNFQSWVDPFIIITALPGALAGIVWMLFLTHTTVSVPVLTGTIMCMGVATANSILMVSFARQNMAQGEEPVTAMLNAGFTRLRPVLMTAFAMIIGMLPMAFGLGEGGEQNAPLGRAVVGGLLFATVATLFFVPAVFCLIHGGKKQSTSDTEFVK